VCEGYQNGEKKKNEFDTLYKSIYQKKVRKKKMKSIKNLIRFTHKEEEEKRKRNRDDLLFAILLISLNRIPLLISI